MNSISNSLLTLLFLGVTTVLLAQDKGALPAREIQEAKEEALQEQPPSRIVEFAVDPTVAPIDAQAAQYEAYLLPRMWQELDFLKNSCELTPEQRPKIKAAALGIVKTCAKKHGRSLEQGHYQKATQALFAELRTQFKSLLDKKQSELYEVATDRRRAARKKTTIRVVVAKLDGLLYLTNEQRDTIMRTFEAEWQDDWESWLDLWRYGVNYYPTLPDKHLTPHLNEQQKSVWKGVQKVSPGINIGDERAQGDLDWWDGKEEQKAPEQKQPAAGNQGERS